MAPFMEIKLETPEEFLRTVGIPLEKFEELVKRVAKHIADHKIAKPLSRRGRKPKQISLEDKTLLSLYYRRHYTTFKNLGHVFDICESYAEKIFHRIEDILVNTLDMPNPEELMDGDVKAIAIDVAEQPIERPQKGQKAYYSGKKKRHTIKIQLIVCLETLRILAVVCRKGSVHDYRILKESRIVIHDKIKKLGDLGYQGIAKLYANTLIPIKKTKMKPLSKEDKKYNRKLSQERVKVELVIRYCKIFRMVKETYRGKHKNYGKAWNVTAALVNFRYAP
jgi:hypothetical protein